MLTGKGSQAILTKTRLEDRQKAMEDNTGYTQSELDELEITGSWGGGRTNPDSFIVEQHPFPIDTTIRDKKDIDIRKVKPELGEMSDE